MLTRTFDTKLIHQLAVTLVTHKKEISSDKNKNRRVSVTIIHTNFLKND